MGGIVKIIKRTKQSLEDKGLSKKDVLQKAGFYLA
jgi:hypothetical protein